MPASSPSARIPKYRRHRPSGQAVVRFNGSDYYLGKYGSQESRDEYDRLLGEWMVNGRQAPPRVVHRPVGQMTVSELILAYLHFADGYYRKNGKPTGEYDSIRYSLKPLRRLYGPTAISAFGPLALKTVREEMIKSDLCRSEINKRMGRIVRMFKWGVENEHVDAMTHHALSQVRGLSRGRSTARESKPVKPVLDAHVDALKPHLPRQIWAMIELQRTTGMRPGEVCNMRSGDIDQSGEVWVYRPETHKTEHHGHERKIYLGPKAQEILQGWLKDDPTAFLFSPKDELEERSRERRDGRKTKIQPSQARRKRKSTPKKMPGDCYEVRSYNRAISRACEKAEIPHWHANQLRHSAATNIRRDFGLDVASLILGHRGVAVTQVYAERDEARAINVVSRVG
ncbi:tyrosine-type recombinase/integrase [Planctellipticum variicoloris]|uniref:tyrosine-type recombinase/integrase n=1 Tax=Planctellipticum variicoloris TaxID=3064265 RepID=UPI003013FF54|nr:site-specific integrase [Planctomycetaceae bacterium SH412]